MPDRINFSDILPHASKISAAYIQNNKVELHEISNVINTITRALLDLSPKRSHDKTLSNNQPIVPIEDSVHDEYIICLEDGKKLQMLKRHLSTVYGMSIAQYKQRWNLPEDYPVVSPSYARRRSDIARTTGLGRQERKKRLSVKQQSDAKNGQDQVAIVVS